MTPNSSLLQWLATFHLSGQQAFQLNNDAYYNLADGFICSRILNQISPQYFTDKWLDGIKPVAPDGSWRLRVSNLKRILQKVHDYASDLQSSQFKLGAINPDVTVIAQNFDPDQISRLIQLILFCAINCGKKQDYIDKIRDLPTQVKQDIKEAIEELLVESDDNHLKLNTSQPSDDLGRKIESTLFNQQSNVSSTLQPVTSSSGIASSSKNVFRSDSSSGDMSRKIDSRIDVSATSSSHNDTNDTIEDMQKKLNEALLAKDEKSQAYHELEIKFRQLQIERDHLFHDNERFLNHNYPAPNRTSDSRRQPHSSNNSDNQRISSVSDPTTNSGVISQDQMLVQNRRLQSEVHRLKQELIRTETEREDYRLKSNLLKDDLNKITTRHEELRAKADQAKRLQDELDEHRQITEKIINYEAMVDNLVKKNNELKRELKSLQEKNLIHIQNVVRLEQENQHMADAVNQVDFYRGQLNEAQNKLIAETHRADQAEAAVTRLTDKLNATTKENEKLFEATNRLRQDTSVRDRIADPANDNKLFEIASVKDGQDSVEPNLGFGNTGGDDIVNSMSTCIIDLKERIARLETEKQLLEIKVNSRSDENKSVMGNLVEEAGEKCRQLERENLQMRKRTLALETSFKEISRSSLQPSTSALSGLIQETDSKNAQIIMRRVEELQRALYQKEHEAREAEARYRKNIHKAKEVIKFLNSNQPTSSSLHPSCMSSTSYNSNSLDEVNMLKQQLRDREERLIELEREFYEFRKLKELHERLMVTAFYQSNDIMEERQDKS